ncbi:hypothetical protein Tco_0704926 [Tanacetum coccineum]|uniref:Uncharacterized protein n=1 Tax=Tanacetum coccineum TaxID=301880 RepID=A0ABQ4Y4X5_9ASTR
MQQIQDKAKKSCIVSFRQLHSHLKLLSNNDLKGTGTEYGFKRAFATLFGQDVETFTGTMFLNMDQIEKQLDNVEYQEIGSMAAFNVLETQFQMFIKSWIYLDDEYVTTEEKVDTSKALDASLVDIESSGTKSKEQDTSSRRNDALLEYCRYKTYMMKRQWLRNQSIVRQPTAFKSKRPRISKPRFVSQVDVNNDLPKPVTTHYLPKEIEYAVAKPHHMIAPGLSRYSSNDMVHNHYLEEAKKKTQESSRNSRPSVMPSAKSQSTVNGSKPKPRINNQKSRNWLASKSSCVMTKTVPIAEHSRNSRKFSNSKHFVCSTCQKCVFNANHDSCVTKLLNEINSRAKVPSNKTTNINKLVEQISVAKKPERQIPKGHRFSIKKTFVVNENTITPRSCLRWKLMGKIFKTVGLRWVLTGKIFTSSTTTVDSDPTNGSNEDITNQYECEKTFDVSAGTLNLSTGTSFNLKKEGLRVWLLKRLISQKPGLQGILI